MEQARPTAVSHLAALRADLNARAAGCWRRSADGSALEQVAFCADRSMPAEVAETFAEATRLLPLDAVNLGVVKAAVTGQVAVSRLDEISADSGSGLWLRRFEAARSIAVPIIYPDFGVLGVVSVALARGAEDETAVAALIRETAGSWFDQATTGRAGPFARQ